MSETENEMEQCVVHQVELKMSQVLLANVDLLRAQSISVREAYMERFLQGR